MPPVRRRARRRVRVTQEIHAKACTARARSQME
jgi:hypothetical protein